MIRNPQTAEDLRDQPVAELFKRLSDETSTLIHQELALAKAEIAQKAKNAGLGIGFMGAAYVFARLMIATLTVAAILAIAIVVPAWAAALIVTGVYGLIALGLVLMGVKRIKAATPPAPTQTIETVKEDVEWLKSRARSAKR
ncbi:MAG: phage holin family protein [Actinomycetota bacterium]|nr:phage holin family protein [Actinomycetota bacterium]